MESESEFGDFPKENDRDVLLEEEEREKLLSTGWFGSIGKQEGVKIGKWTKGRRRLQGLGRRIFLRRDSVNSGDEDERDRFFDKDEPDYKPRKPSFKWVACITVGLLTFLLLVIIGSVQLSLPKKFKMPPHATMSNGTHLFFPTTILISLDGFRPDFVSPELTPALSRFASQGVRPPYMSPAFPSVTFPNHWTLVTGLHPESHGIVSNHFYDPIQEKEFHYTDPLRSLQSEWWGGTPIWSLAEKQSVRTSVSMWPGSEVPPTAKLIKPAYLDHFLRNESLPAKVTKILDHLDLPTRQRPQLILSYVPDVDISGHKAGPNSTATHNAIAEVDKMFSSLLTSLDARNLTSITNIVVVSDHGMLTTSNERLIYLDDILPSYSTKIGPIEGWPLYGLRPKPGVSVSDLYNTLLAARDAQPEVVMPFTTDKKKIKPFSVYTRETMPERFHYSNNERIAPVIIVPEPGWIITTREEHPDETQPYDPVGVHGYDNLHPLMRSLFIARGPAFERAGLHGPIGNATALQAGKEKEEKDGGRVVEPFGNWEVYGLVADSLGLKWRQEQVNGTMGIAGMKLLKSEAEEAVVPSSFVTSIVSSTSTPSPVPTAVAPAPTEKPEESKAPEKEKEKGKDKDHDDDDDDDEKDGVGHKAKEKLKGWWGKFKHKAGKLKDKLEEWWDGVWVEKEEEDD
ncbi:Phosphodiest-domain-containing protein [Ascobolus immersus RN42]|uniref:Phosphodiest-domain-containing protein n=1 Tax=Ascobolus immersus RN42 TaxID=1160509 RepID=A0A3N4I912_ASCIM|nr:Phosphodiest-domain-containing protein [Ascobolus immersus RN42]